MLRFRKNKKEKFAKYSKKIFPMIGFSALVTTVPFVVQNITGSKQNTNLRVVQKGNLSTSQNPQTTQSSHLDGSDFFEIYKNHTVSSQNDFTTWGNVSAVKISGLPFSSVQSTLNPGTFIKQTSINDISLLDSSNKKSNCFDQFVTKDPINDSDKFGDTLINGVEVIDKISSPQAVELNNVLKTPTALKDVQISMNLQRFGSVVKNWAKIGSVSLLMEDGTVYRADNININDVMIAGAPSDGSQPNISFAKLLDWMKWSKDGDKSSAFMISYDRSKLTTIDENNQVYFVDGLESRRSSTPIISGGKVKVISVDAKGNINEQIPIKKQLTIQQEFNFLLEINDQGFVRSFLRSVNHDSGSWDSITPSLLTYFDQFKIKSDYSSNSKYWNLNLVYDGTSSSMDRSSFSNLVFLENMQNIIKFKIYTNEIAEDSYYNFDLDDLYWLSKWTKVEEIDIPGAGSPNSVAGNNAHAFGSVSNMNWIGDIPSLKRIDLSALGEYDQNVDSEFINSGWKDSLAFDFKITLDASMLKKTQNNAALVLDYKVNAIGGLDKTTQYPVLTKIVAPTFPQPKIILNPKYTLQKNGTEPRYIFSEMKLDNKPLEVLASGGKLYWNFKKIPIDPIQIAYTTGGDNFYTTNFVKGLLDKTGYNSAGISKNYFGGLAISQQTLKNDGPVSFANYSLLNDKIWVDGKQYPKVVYKSEVFFDYDLANIKFYATTSRGIEYFTNLDSLLAIVPLDEFDKYGVFSIEPKPDSLITYQEYAALNKDKFSIPDPIPFDSSNSITVDGQKFGDILVNGILMWDLKGKKVEDIKFVNTATNDFYTSAFDDKSNVVPNLLSVKKHRPYALEPKLLPPLQQPGPISSIDDINTKIRVDGVDKGVILYNGNIVYDTDISQIKYQRQYEDGQGNELIEYYTSFDKMPRSMTLEGISQLEPSKETVIQPPLISNYSSSSNSGKNFVVIDDVAYESSLRNGKWYWGAPDDLIKKVSYVDSNNNYFTKLDRNNFQNQGISQIRVDFQIPPKNEEFVFPQKLSLQNIEMVNSGLDIKSSVTGKTKHYDFVVKDSNVYLSHEMKFVFNFETKNTLGKANYYFNYEDIPVQERQFAWSFKDNDTESREANLLVSPEKRENAKSPFEPLVIFDDNGARKSVNILYNISEDKYYYEDLLALKSIKFEDEYGNYYTKIPKDNMSLKFNSIDIEKSKIDEYAQPLIKSDVQVTKVTKEIAEAIVGSGLAVIGASGATWSVISFVKRKGRK